MFRKILKILLVVFIILAVIITSVAVWQWKNIQSILLGIREDYEGIENLRNENQEKLVEDINTIMDIPLRDMTEDEKKQIEAGEITVNDVYQKMFEEKTENPEGKESTGSGGKKDGETSGKEPQTQPDPSDEKKETRTKDQIISGAMSELYKIQNEFNARAEATIREGDRYYMSIRQHPQDPVARSNTIAHFTPIVRAVERECDAKVEAVIVQLEKDLKSIGADTSIIATIRTTYANEKQYKLSYYSNKYLK